MHAIKDSFLETFASLISEEKYNQFVGRCGPIEEIPDEIRAVGQREAIPYINSGCRTSYCVYDISTLHELYAQEFDLADEFRPQEHFSCFYCDQKINYGNFSTCESLVQSVENLFGQRAKPGNSSSIHRSIIKSHGSRSNFHLDESLSLVKRRRSKFEEPNSGLKNGIVLHEASDSELELRQWAELDLQPRAEPKPQILPNTQDKQMLPIIDSENSIAPSKRKTSSVSENPKTNKSVMTKFVPKHKKSSTRSIQLPDWQDLKNRLAAVPIPDINLFDTSELQRLGSLITSKRQIELKPDPKFTSWLKVVPSLQDLRNLEETGRMCESLFDAILFYLRCLMSKHQNKLGFFWHFFSDQGGKPVAEKSLLNKEIVLNNTDHDKAFIILSGADHTQVFVHEKITSRLTKIDLHRAEAKDDHLPNEIFPKSASVGSSTEMRSLFSEIMDLYADLLITNKSSLTFHRSIYLSKDVGYLAYVQLIIRLAGLETLSPLFQQESLRELVRWILYKIFNPAVMNMTSKITVTGAKPILKKKQEPAPPNIYSKDKSHGSSSSILVDTEETRVDLIQNLIHKPDLTKAAEIKPPNSVQLDKKYDEIKSLLEFYQKHDRDRHASLLKKCQASYPAEVVNYLQKSSHKSKTGHKNQVSLNQIRLRDIVKSTPSSPKLAANSASLNGMLKGTMRTGAAGSPQNSTHFISSPYLAPFVVRSQQAVDYTLRDRISAQELPALKTDAVKSLRHLEVPVAKNSSLLEDVRHPLRLEMHKSYRRLGILGLEAQSAASGRELMPRTTPNSPKGSYVQQASRPRFLGPS